jgi:hypothetical protein
MAQLSYDEKHCVRFLNKFKDWPDPTWGFWVYGTYSRPQGQSDAAGEVDGDTNAQEAAGERHYHVTWEKYGNLLIAVMYRYRAFPGCAGKTARPRGRHAMVPPSGAV